MNNDAPISQDMMLTEQLKDYFFPSTASRGTKYYKQKRVHLLSCTDHAFRFTVSGSESYTVTIFRGAEQHSNSVIVHCTCPYFQGYQGHCKHTWACFAFMDHFRFAKNFLKSVHPPMLYDLESHAIASRQSEDHWLELIEKHLEENGKNELELEKSDTQWKRQMEALKEDMKIASTVAQISKRKHQNYRELYYVVNTVPYRQRDNELIIDLFQKERLKSGKMGRLKKYTCSYSLTGIYDSLSNEQDRDIVITFASHLENYRYRNNENHFVIPKLLCSLALEKMSETGRLVTSIEDDYSRQPNYQPLSFDQTPLLFRPCVSATDNFWELEGRFLSGDQMFSHKEVEIMDSVNFAICDGIIRPFSMKGEHSPLLAQARNDKKLKIPKEHRDDLKVFIEQFMDPSDVIFDESFNFKKELLKGNPRFDIADDPQKIEGILCFEYDGEKHVPLTKDAITKEAANDIFFVKDIEQEKSVVGQIQSSEFFSRDSSEIDNKYTINSESFLEAVQFLNEIGVEVMAEGRQVIPPTKTFSAVSSGVDWLELDSEVEFDNLKIAAPQILKIAQENRQYIRLSDNRMGVLPKNWLKRYMRLKELAIKNKDGKLQFHGSQALILDALLEDQNVERDEAYSKILHSFKNYKKLKQVAPAKNFNGTLRPYQKTGLSWMNFLQDMNMAGCLADDMGLGKTIQVLALLQKRKYLKKRTSKTSCIVVPKTIISNWNSEAAKFAPNLNVCIYEGVDRKSLRENFSNFDIIILTYGVLRRDVMELRKFHFDYVILDEAQAIKNESSLSAKSAYLLKSNHRLAMTGTPVENHLGELFSIFKFLLPNVFRKKIASYKNLNTIDDATELILKGLRPFILRRTKEEVLTELPEKTESVLYCEMPTKQKNEYEKIKAYYKTHLSEKIQLQGINKSKIQILEALTRLRQVACHPGLLDPKKSAHDSGKTDALIEQLETIQAEGKRALVFSQFTSMLSIVKSKLDKNSIAYSYLDGSTRKREQVISEFKNNPQISIFLISLKAGGVGLNLTEANYCFILDPWWNPAVENQAIDRAYRIGQKNKVTAYKLISKNTVEEKIVELQNKKKNLIKNVMSYNENILKKMTLEDVSYLFS